MDLQPGGRPPTWSPPDVTRRAAVSQNELKYFFLEGFSRCDSILTGFDDFLENCLAHFNSDFFKAFLDDSLDDFLGDF